jgi:4-hydroxy-2-oxoheptanedioate aldolase
VAGSGCDFVLIDHQHGWFGLDSVVRAIQALDGLGVPALVRVPVGEVGLAAIQRVLDCGAMGVVVPVVESVAQAELAVAACRYPPRGSRSYGPSLLKLRHGAETLDELADVVCALQIESALGYENAESILSVPGVDAMFMGPVDLAISQGEPMYAYTDREDPLDLPVVRRLMDVCRTQGVVPGIGCGADAAAAFIGAGFCFVTAGTDTTSIQTVLAGDLAEARSAS